MNDEQTSESMTYDVIVMGGALSGSSNAILLMRNNPGLRVLIIEKNEQLARRVGEATVEISTYFMGRVLGLTKYLNECQIAKQGLRFWFRNEDVKGVGDASELGGKYNVRLPSYQVDRATLDEEVLRRAVEQGATLLRPASISSVQLNEGGQQEVSVKYMGVSRTYRARWVVDATGVAAILARKNGWWKSNTEHPTAAAWSRWKGVKDWDCRKLAEKYPEWASAIYGIRGTATNHVIGDGWWSWWIPLKGGDTSVGVVIDQRLVDWPQDGGKVGDKLKNFLMEHPVGREMLADATYDEEDMHWRRNLAYYSTTFAGDGFALVGDASAFMDPFYSPGMDWISFTSYNVAHLITAHFKGEPMMAEKIKAHNEKVALSHRSWFLSVYKDKYEYMGEWDLMSIAFELDLGLYYVGIVSQPLKRGEMALLEMPFTTGPSRPVFHFMQAYNRRFARIAQHRRERGVLGRTNRLNRTLIPGFTMKGSDTSIILGAAWKWLKIELGEGWRTWFTPRRREAEQPVMEPAAQKVAAGQ